MNFLFVCFYELPYRLSGRIHNFHFTSCVFVNLIRSFLKRFRSNVRFLSTSGYIVHPRILAEPFCHVVPAVRKRRQKSAVLLRRFLSGKVCFCLIPFFLRQHREIRQKDGGDSQTQLCGVALRFRVIGYFPCLLHHKPVIFKIQNGTLRRQHLIADHALHRYFPFNCADIRNRGRDFFIHILPHADRRNRDHIRRLGIGCDLRVAPKAFPQQANARACIRNKKEAVFSIGRYGNQQDPPTSLYGILTLFPPFRFRISAPRQALCFAYHSKI